MSSVIALNCPSCGAPIDPKQAAGPQFTCPACGSSLMLTDWTDTGSVICRDCGTANSSQSKFCLQCHKPLQAGCPMCYTLNPLSAARCHKCGVDLQRAWKRQAAWLAEKQRLNQERRQAMQQAYQADRQAEIARLLLQLDDPLNHPTAIYSLQQVGVDAVPGLINLLKDPDPDARYGAAHTLGLIGSSQAIPALVEALNDPQAEVRFWAAAALGRMQAVDTVFALADLLNDPKEEVRQAAAEALEHIGTPEAQAALRQHKHSSWWPFG